MLMDDFVSQEERQLEKAIDLPALNRLFCLKKSYNVNKILKIDFIFFYNLYYKNYIIKTIIV